MGLYKEIRRDYGDAVWRLAKTLSTLTLKLASVTARRIFLLQCRHRRVFSNFIKHSCLHLDAMLSPGNPMNNEISKLILRTKSRILSLEIKIVIHKVDKLRSQINNIKSMLNERLPDMIYVRLVRCNSLAKDQHFQLCRFKLVNKLKAICNNDYGGLERQVNDEYSSFHNLTTIPIPENCCKLLSLGPKFSLSCQSQNFPLYDIIGDIELALGDLPSYEQPHVRAQCVNILTNYRNGLTRNRGMDQYNKAYDATRRFLKEHPEILITRADKGNRTVAMLKADYEEKMKNMLEDSSTYKKLGKDFTNSLQNRANAFVQQLIDDGHINNSEGQRLKSCNATVPRIYGLPKIHKKDVPLRPIVSFINSPSYNLARYVSGISSNITTNEYTVSNSIAAREIITSITVPPDETLLSLDVTSLFTNVPIDLVVHIIRRRWDEIGRFTTIPLDLFIDILEYKV